MKIQLITSAQVLDMAFSSIEQLREDLVNDNMIQVAQQKFLKPVLGGFYDMLPEPQYAGFLDGYIRPALAYYVKSLAISELEAGIGNMGIMQYTGDTGKAAPPTSLSRLRCKAKHDGDTLMRQAVEQIETEPEKFPEYNPRENIMHRIRIAGGIVIPR